MPEARPWFRVYGRTPRTLDYPPITLWEALARTAAERPRAIAWEFFGARSTYRGLVEDIDRCAAAFASEGLAPGDRILISMPTSPPGVIAFYGALRAGAVAAMIHPLSTTAEITQYLDQTGARFAMVLDALYPALAAATPRRALERIVVARIPDHLPWPKRIAFALTRGRSIAPLPPDARVRRWKALLESGGTPPQVEARCDDPAAILFSGGTTGWPKGIVLTHRNFIAQGKAAGAWVDLDVGDSMLAALPLFHGFGLAVCINATLMAGARAILVPQFSPEIIAKRIRRDRPSLVVGVPTLFDALARDPSLARADLSSLGACFCGADTLSAEVRAAWERRVVECGGQARLLEGYGLTEAVSGVIATPLEAPRAGSVGVPLPGVDAMICAPGGIEALAPDTEGEICIAGDAVMQGYLDDPQATAQALRRHADGRTWLHTGDLGRMDADGYFYFTVRLKRMIKSSGFNVYPAQVEAVLRQHPRVEDACVVGVPDPEQVERVVAWVVARGAAEEALAAELIAFCRERLIKWSCPREVRFLEALPQTKVGKIDYRALAGREPSPEAT